MRWQGDDALPAVDGHPDLRPGTRPGRASALAGDGAELQLAAFTGSRGGGSGGSGDGAAVTRTALRRLR